MKKKTVEWKPTAEPWVIDRGFSLFVKNRCVFAHARAGNWRARLNWAANFASPNRIVVLYLYGKVDFNKLETALAAKPGHIIAAILPVMKDDISIWDRGEKERESLRTAGYTEGKLREQTEKAERHPQRELFESLIQQDRGKLDIIDAANNALERIHAAQNEPATVLSNFAPRTIWHSDHETELLETAIRLYPCGVEANAPSEQGAKMLKIKPLVNEAVNGTVGSAVSACVGHPNAVQLSLFDEVKLGAATMIDHGSAWCERQICERGCFSVSDLMQVLSAPPYGWYECNYYAYIRARILEPYMHEPYLLYSGVTAFRLGDFDPVNMLQRPSGIIFRQSAKQREMAAAVRTIFPTEPTIGTQQAYGLGHEIVKACMQYISGRINTPLAVADQRWNEIFRASGEEWCDRTFAERYYDFLIDMPARRHEVETIDHIFDGQYDSEKLRLFYKFYHVKGGAVGWLWDPDDFRKRLEEYMANDVCRECGKPLVSQFHDGVVDVCQGANTKTVRFTKKEIVGLNKKYLGRYQDEYFCTRCLCQILDKSPDELREKIEQFKQQGCELF